MTWQPIATAPQDGTEILLACDDGAVGAGFWDHAQAAWRAKPGWFWEMDRGDLGTAKNAFGVTHWQPLPEAPVDRPAPPGWAELENHR